MTGREWPWPERPRATEREERGARRLSRSRWVQSRGRRFQGVPRYPSSANLFLGTPLNVQMHTARGGDADVF